MTAKNGARIDNRGRWDVLKPVSLLSGGGAPSEFINYSIFSADLALTEDKVVVGIKFVNKSLVEAVVGEIEFTDWLHQEDAAPMSVLTLDIRLGGVISAARFAFAAGSVAGFGNLVITQELTWSGGTMKDGGKTFIANTATARLQAANHSVDLTDAREFRNDGTVRWLSGNIEMTNGAVIINKNMFKVECDASVVGNTMTERIENQRFFNKVATAGTTEIQVRFNNFSVPNSPAAAVDIVTGTLQLKGPGTHNSPFYINQNSVLDLTTSDAVHDMRAGTGFFQGNDGPGPVRIREGASIEVPVDAIVTADWLHLSVDGMLSSPGTLEILKMEWTGGTIVDATGLGQIVIVDPDGGSSPLEGRLEIKGNDGKAIDGMRLINQGTATWTGLGDIQMANGATWENRGLLDIQNDRNITNGGGAASRITNNLGTPPWGKGIIRKSGGPGTTTIDVDFHNLPGGTRDLKAGTLKFQRQNKDEGKTILDGGRMSSTQVIDLDGALLVGAGELEGDVLLRNSGMIEVGGIGAVGLIEIIGDYAQLFDASLRIEIGDAGSDTLAISGHASLSGTIAIFLLDGYDPPSGAFYDLVFWDSYSGSFLSPPSLNFGLVYFDDKLRAMAL